MPNKSSGLELTIACAVLRRFLSPLILGVLCINALLHPLTSAADSSDLIKGNRSVTMPSPPPPQVKNPEPPINCTQLTRDPRCRSIYPDYRPQPYYRRPIIINSEPTPASTPVDVNALKDDWEGCRSAKMSAINSRRSGSLDQANRLDEWLWKNCRYYSEELRDLE